MRLGFLFWKRGFLLGLGAILAAWLVVTYFRTSPAQMLRVGVLSSAIIDEASGLAPSVRTEGVYWVHNDSGGEPVIYAINGEGQLKGSVRLAGVKNIDWEDVASFSLDGRPYLLVADVGDNDGVRKDCRLHVVEEPDTRLLSPTVEVVLPVAWSLPVRYGDGPHDCEAVGVDEKAQRVYLLRKREYPAPLYSLSLRPEAGEVVEARFEGMVSGLPQPTANQRRTPVATGRYRGEPVAMSFSSDGQYVAVLTYGDVAIFQRRGGEKWAVAMARTPVLLPPHGLAQAEAMGVARDGRAILVTEEATHAPVLRYELTLPER